MSTHGDAVEQLRFSPEEGDANVQRLRETVKKLEETGKFDDFLKTLTDPQKEFFLKALNDDTFENFNQEGNPIESAEEQISSAETKEALAHILEQLKTLPKKALEILQKTAHGVWETWKNLPLPLRIASIMTVIIGTPIAAMEILELVNAGYATHIVQVLNSLIPEALTPEILKQAFRAISAANPAGMG
ncbi:hypothetical protein IPN35_06395 [Candidatus Peregrinibacteria bacterium]|nr:MAG: hypothetical protein IPN35_06395 [Candidatus Peregrinibacteria bacterium]